MTNEYEEGLRDGKISAIEKMQTSQNDRLDHHERRLIIAERILYGLMGSIALLQAIPLIREVV